VSKMNAAFREFLENKLGEIEDRIKRDLFPLYGHFEITQLSIRKEKEGSRARIYLYISTDKGAFSIEERKGDE